MHQPSLHMQLRGATMFNSILGIICCCRRFMELVGCVDGRCSLLPELCCKHADALAAQLTACLLAADDLGLAALVMELLGLLSGYQGFMADMFVER